MRIIALMNQKGGVGKTTTTVNLGAALAELGFTVCLIDLDPQAHLSINYGLELTPESISLYNVLVEDRPLIDGMHKIDSRITLIPSTIDLAAAEIELVSVLGRESLLKKKLEAAACDFDFILLDCPPFPRPAHHQRSGGGERSNHPDAPAFSRASGCGEIAGDRVARQQTDESQS